MTRLLISSGKGPAETRLAVGHILRLMAGSAVEVVTGKADKYGPASAIVTLPTAAAARWRGTILWRCQSPLRPQHKRKNWFVGVFALAELQKQDQRLHPKELRFERFRAGGPGGQHQNTTDSAVRVVHLPSGLVAISRDQRSQHRNKAKALARLETMLALAQIEADADMLKRLNQLHQTLARGAPTRIFTGIRFKEQL